MNDIRGPLDDFLGKNVKWYCSEKCHTACTKLKGILCPDLYEPDLLIVEGADASTYALEQIFKAVCHASQSLTPTKSKYT